MSAAGRTMPGRRWSDGLHQAVEAKERLDIQNESVTLASISYQVGPGAGAGAGVLGRGRHMRRGAGRGAKSLGRQGDPAEERLRAGMARWGRAGQLPWLGRRALSSRPPARRTSSAPTPSWRA